MPTPDVLTLMKTWAETEQRGDTAALTDLLTDDFEAVGPRGFVLTKDQWLDRYRTGALRNTSFSLQDPRVRPYGDTAVTIGTQVQESTFGDHDASGTFRATVVTVHQNHRWLIAAVHLSPIAAPPGHENTTGSRRA